MLARLSVPCRRLGRKALTTESPDSHNGRDAPAARNGSGTPGSHNRRDADGARKRRARERSKRFGGAEHFRLTHFRLTQPCASRPVPPQRGRAGRRELLVVVPLAFVLAAALWHNAWANPFSTQLGGLGDADEYAWFLAWMPYALGHGLDPLISHYANFPSGVNLMWNTSVVLPSFIMSPFTVIFGAAFSYNILMTTAPALSATFAYVAFRRWAAPLPSPRAR